MSRQYTIHGDPWDFLFEENRKKEGHGMFIPFTLEMGSWMWLKKNPLQVFSKDGVFHPTLPHRRSAPRFAVVALSSLALNTALMAVAVDWLRWPYLPAQVLTTSLVLASNFAFSRLWAFRHSTAGQS